MLLFPKLYNNLTFIMIETNNNIESVHQKIQENDDEITSLTEVVKKLKDKKLK